MSRLSDREDLDLFTSETIRSVSEGEQRQGVLSEREMGDEGWLDKCVCVCVCACARARARVWLSVLAVCTYIEKCVVWVYLFSLYGPSPRVYWQADALLTPASLFHSIPFPFLTRVNKYQTPIYHSFVVSLEPYHSFTALLGTSHSFLGYPAQEPQTPSQLHIPLTPSPARQLKQHQSVCGDPLHHPSGTEITEGKSRLIALS